MLNKADVSTGKETAGSDLLTVVGACANVRQLADAVIRDQFQGWRDGHGRSAEDYLREHPLLAADPEICLDVVYAEFRIRDELGQRPEQAEFLRRFPKLSDSLRRQFEVGGWLHGELSVTDPAASSSNGDTATVDQPALPLTLDDFELGARLGAGAMGEVFAARQRSLNRQVAIKFLRREVTVGADRQRRFLREATAAAAVRHPGVVAIHGIGQDDGRLFLVQELVDGASLDSQLKSGPMALAESVRITIALADAVAAIHSAGILHRDLKPANVLLDRNGRVQVGDFGLSKSLDAQTADLSVEGQIIGTPQFMAPEQAAPRRGELTAATDIYGVGAILFTLLTGRPPPGQGTLTEILMRVAAGQVARSPRALRSEVPAALDEVCQKCLALDPLHRYQSAAQLRSALHACVDECVATGVTGPSAGLHERTRRRAMKWIAALPVAAMAAIGGWEFVSSPPSAILKDAVQHSPVAPANMGWNVGILRREAPEHIDSLSAYSPAFRTGDSLQIEANFAEPMYALGFWIGSDGQVRPLPSAGATAIQAARHWQTPAEPHAALPLTPPAGLELCVLVYARQPLDPAEPWAMRLAAPVDLSLPSVDRALVSQSGQIISEDTAALPPELASQLTQASRPVGAPIDVRALSLSASLDRWRESVETPQVHMAYLALRHVAAEE